MTASEALKLIAEGNFCHCVDDRFIVIHNPEFTADNGEPPYHLYDTHTVEEEMDDEDVDTDYGVCTGYTPALH